MEYFAVILFLLNICAINCQINNHAKAYKVECTFSETYIINGSCSLKPVNRRSSAFNLYAYLIKPIDSFMISVKLFRRYNTFVPFPINLRLNGCDYLSGQKKSYLFNIAKDRLDKYSNVNHSCPYSGAIIAKNLVFIPNLILTNDTTLLPEGIYRLDIQTFKENEENFIALGSAYIEIKEENV